MDINKYLPTKKAVIDKALRKLMPAKNSFPNSIHKAMHYSIFNGGKRIRPILAIAACETLGGNIKIALPAACAIELIHCSSLILDDLPCMDNDDYRRGKPTCHKVFGEDITILANNALLLLAFEIIGNIKSISPDKKIRIITKLARSTGSQGLVGGQIIDLESEGKTIDKKTLGYIHLHKTAMLIESSVYTGALIGNATESQLKSLSNYGRNIGLAFQIADDILDITGDFKKATYPNLYGINKTRKILQNLKKDAISNLSIFGKKADILRDIADYIINRTN